MIVSGESVEWGNTQDGEPRDLAVAECSSSEAYGRQAAIPEVTPVTIDIAGTTEPLAEQPEDGLVCGEAGMGCAVEDPGQVGVSIPLIRRQVVEKLDRRLPATAAASPRPLAEVASAPSMVRVGLGEVFEPVGTAAARRTSPTAGGPDELQPVEDKGTTGETVPRLGAEQAADLAAVSADRPEGSRTAISEPTPGDRGVHPAEHVRTDEADDSLSGELDRAGDGGHDDTGTAETAFDEPNDEGGDEGEHETVDVSDLPEADRPEAEHELVEQILAAERAAQVLEDDELFSQTLAKGSIQSPEELATTLIREVAAGSEARQRLATDNLNLVSWGVERFGGFLPYRIAASAARFGIFRAAQKFDPANGAPFRPYAAVWMHREIFNATYEEAFQFRLPRMFGTRFVAYLNRLDRLTMDLGHTPTDEELAAGLHVTAEELHNMQVLEARILQSVMVDHTRLASSGEQGPGNPALTLILERMGTGSPADGPALRRVFSEEIATAVDNALPYLTEGQERVMRLRTGIGMPEGFSPMTISEIAEYLDESINTVSARVNRAYVALRRNPALAELMEELRLYM
jgi:RNA polymerase primary sigma factor